MAIEIKDSKPVLRYNLGGADGEAIVEKDVSDGNWHRIVAERLVICWGECLFGCKSGRQVGVCVGCM